MQEDQQRRIEEENRRRMDEEKRKREEEERRRKMEEEQKKLEEERMKMQQERLLMEAEKNRKMQVPIPYEIIKPNVPDYSLFYEQQKKELADQMRYLQEQRQKFRDELERYEYGQRILQQENIKILEEGKERDRLRESKQQMYDPFTFKDTPAKTFYMGYTQKKYKIANQTFPERVSYSNNKMTDQDLVNDIYNQYQSQINYKTINNSLCHTCGKFIASQMNNSQYNYGLSNNLCPGCGKIVLQ